MSYNVVMSRDAWKKAIQQAGTQAKLADLIGKTQGHISTWLRRGYVPPELVLVIEKQTGISRHELRPDLYPRERRSA